jgi:FAD/FMN-containing dehydrogenase
MAVIIDDARSRLRDVLGDRLFTPTDPGYDTARLPWNRAVDQRPFAVALPRSDDEVAAIVRVAAASGLRIAPQSTGHGAGARVDRDLSNTILVSLENLRGATVDPEARTATVRGGSIWNDVVEAAAPHGLATLHGSSGDVSVAGYTLGGGISFYGRRHGLAVNAVRSVRVVTAQGTIVTASADENSDLFWAVRGASGGVGVVVSLEIDLLPYPDVFAGMMLWDAARAAEVAHAWREWTVDAPESATTSMRIMHFPPIPELPPFLSGRSVIVIDGAVLETDADAADLLAPLRALQPEIDTFARIPAARLVEMHMDPPEPSPAVTDHAMLDTLDAAAVDAFIAAANEHRPMMSEIRHVGGSFSRPAVDGGALTALEGGYVLTAIAMVPAPAMMDAAAHAVSAVVAALSAWHGTGIALTFIEDDRDLAPAFGAGAARLSALRHELDPDRVFAPAHGIA